MNTVSAMFKACVFVSMFGGFSLAPAAMVCPDGSNPTRSKTIVLAHAHVRPQVAGSANCAMPSAGCHDFSRTLMAHQALDEGTVCRDDPYAFQLPSPGWMDSEKALQLPISGSVTHTISSLQQRQESCIFPDRHAASLRRLTKPLRVFPRRRLSRGACRPPSIPPAFAAFERVHARAWLGSAP